MNALQTSPSPPKRRGRAARCGAQPQVAPVVQPRRRVPAYAVLKDAALARIEAQADWILDKIGVEFRGDAEALDLFRAAGARVQGERVQFAPGHVRALCATAPEQFELHARDPRYSVTLGGDHLVLMPGYGSPFVTDLRGGRRYGTLEDFRSFVKLAWMSPYLQHSGGTVVEPCDLPVNKRHLDMMLGHLTLSAKPFMGAVTAPERAQDSIEMARIVFGAPFMARHAVMQGNINVNSPLVYDGVMSQALRVYAEAGQCVCVSPAIFGGAMGPLSPAAMAAQTLAEAMVGIALAQLVRPGVPCVFGSFHSTMNLKSGALTFGSPEANLVTMVLSQLGRRLGVPVRSGGGQVTASNTADGQAMQDSTGAMWATLISGTHQVWHAAGWLEGGLTMSYEKFILDLDHCGMMLRMLGGLAVDEAVFAKESYFEAGPGETFLSTADTMARYAGANYLSDLPEAGPFETWVEAGALRADERAAARWADMLARYTPPEMNDSVREALDAYVARRKSEAEDAWY